jgi:hypothetical protein
MLLPRKLDWEAHGKQRQGFPALHSRAVGALSSAPVLLIRVTDRRRLASVTRSGHDRGGPQRILFSFGRAKGESRIRMGAFHHRLYIFSLVFTCSQKAKMLRIYEKCVRLQPSLLHLL